MVEVKGLESLLQIEGGGGEDNDAEHGVVIQPVPGAVASIGDPEQNVYTHVLGIYTFLMHIGPPAVIRDLWLQP